MGCWVGFVGLSWPLGNGGLGGDDDGGEDFGGDDGGGGGDVDVDGGR